MECSWHTSHWNKSFINMVSFNPYNHNSMTVLLHSLFYRKENQEPETWNNCLESHSLEVIEPGYEPTWSGSMAQVLNGSIVLPGYKWPWRISWLTKWFATKEWCIHSSLCKEKDVLERHQQMDGDHLEA